MSLIDFAKFIGEFAILIIAVAIAFIIFEIVFKKSNGDK
jgi:hypothetical protein